MFSNSHSTRERELEFAPLLFSLSAADGIAVVTPRTSARTLHRDDSSMSGQRRSNTTPGSIHTETTPPTPPPPMMRLIDDVVMEETSTSKAARMGGMAPPMQSLAGITGRDALQPYYERAAPEYQDVWVTVFGFSQNDTSIVLKEFSKCGDILQWGTFGHPQANYLHLQFQNKYAAQRALIRNGELLSPSLIVGVKPLEARHRAQIEDYLAGGGGGGGGGDYGDLAINRSEVPMERPYRFDTPSQAVVPQPRSVASKVVEFVFGF